MKPKRSFRRPLPLLVLALLVLAPAGLLAHPPDTPSDAETLILFDPAALETPESIAIDREGNTYISLALTGEIRRIAPDGTQSTLALLPIGPPLTFCGPFFNAVTGITLDRKETALYVSVVSCDPASRGVWRVPLDGGAPELLATLPFESIPNGIAWWRGDLYVADSTLGLIWRVPEEGGTAEVWSDDPLLSGGGSPGMFLPGANGVQVFRKELYVANSTQGTIVAIPLGPHGEAGTPRIHAVLPAGAGCDDFAIDAHGSIYCTTGPSNLLVRLDPDGTTEILLTGEDGLGGPTAVTFGRKGADRFNLYITNAAFPFLPIPGARPSLMRLHLGVPGAPPSW
jgi:sugar lactone lactonase YvrE